MPNTLSRIFKGTIDTDEINFHDIKFDYIPNQNLLNGFNLKIEAGQFIGIVGPTGSGKRTILKLLLRFYDPKQGTITLDGVPLSELSLEQLRGSIGYVGQDVFLMDTTIKENLGLGKKDLEEIDYQTALKAADALNFVNELPKRLETPIGERGQRLSGGQRQRLTIARGLLGHPPILVFDEATSAVDNETEEAIQKAIRTLAKSRTMIIIAHRLSTIRHADRIIVLEDGKICEEGQHEQLLTNEGLYNKLWSLQTGGSAESS